MSLFLRVIPAFLAGLTICGCTVTRQSISFLPLCVSSASASSSQVPVEAKIVLPEPMRQALLDEITVTLKEEEGDGVVVPGQLVRADDGTLSLWWVMPEARAGGESRWIAAFSRIAKPDSATFEWENETGRQIDLLFNGTRKLRYVCAYDPTTEESLQETYKPYYHIFDAKGENLLTKGSGGLYTHHRGLFLGWNRLTLEGAEYDFWHMKGVVQRHVQVLEQQAGPVLARLKTRIHWDCKEDDPVLVEDREVTLFRQELPNLLLLDFRSTLKAVKGDLFLNGDPEHAGFQYRPHNDVAEGKDDETIRARYLFPSKENDPLKDTDLPWVAMTYGLNGRQYTVQHMNAPGNPEGTLYSAYRDYGRFGAFCTPAIAAGQTLTLRYRVFIREGDSPDREAMCGRYSAFVQGPSVEVVSTR
ncbi:MAG: DUF6807 family protein [Planctomycetota bacterium]